MTHRSGDALPPFRIAHVSAEGMKVWAKILHDPNPIHLDPAVVRAKGLGDRVINQGPCNVAYMINMLQKAFPGCMIEALDTRFVDNVFAGDTIEAAGKVTEVTQAGGKTKVQCEIWLRAEGRPEGRDMVLTGTAVVALP